MRLPRICSLLCIITCCVSCAAVSIPVENRACPLRDAADVPTWYPGDVWTYRVDPLSFSDVNGSFIGVIDNFQETVVGVHDDVYELTISADISGTFTNGGITGDLTGTITGTSTTRRSDLAQGTTILASTGTIIPDFPPIPLPFTADLTYSSTPPLELFDFPLNVGDQWHIHCDSTTTGSIVIAGLLDQSLDSNQTIDEDVSCPQQATISVPAGSFDCYEIGREDADIWYSPEVGNLVKSTVDQSDENGSVHAVLALQSFSQSVQPLTVTEVLSASAVYPGASVVVSGSVVNSQTQAPVVGGAVTVEIPATGDVWTATTNSSGGYLVTFAAPVVPDDTPVPHETGSGGVVVRCQKNGLEGYCVRTLTTLENTPPAAPTITGDSQGKPGVQYTYGLCSIDPENDTVWYFVDWGDNSSSDWVGPSASGVNVTLTHTFAKKGTYSIRAKAKDDSGAESNWSTFEVKMPVAFSYHACWQWFFERFPHAFPLLRWLLMHC